MKRTPFAAVSVASLAILGGVAAGGGDGSGGAIGRVKSEVGGAIDTATSKAGGAVDTVTSKVGGAVGTVTSEVGKATGSGSGTSQVVAITADPQRLAFARTSLTARAGSITLRMTNPSAIGHNIAIQNPNRKGKVVSQGGVSEVTADLGPGSYTYYCSVPGHLEAGMKGTLTVT